MSWGLQLFSVLFVLTFCRSGDSATLELDGNKFMERRGANEAWLLVFYAEWCGHCQKLMPIFDRISARLRGTPIRTGKIESSRAGPASRHYQVNGYPSIVYVHGDQWHSFDGARTEDSLYKFALRSYGPSLKLVDTAKRFEELVRLHENDVFFALLCDADTCIQHGVTQLPTAFANVTNVMQLRGDFYYGSRAVFPQLFSEELFPPASEQTGSNDRQLEENSADENAANSVALELEKGGATLSIAGRTLLVDRASCERVVNAAVAGVDEMIVVIKDGALFCFDQLAEQERTAKRLAEQAQKAAASETSEESEKLKSADSEVDAPRESEEDALVALVGRWVNAERFIAFAPIGGVEVNELATTGKRLALFVTLNATSLGDKSLDAAGLNAFFHRTGRALSRRRATYHSRYQFAWLTDVETVHLMILSRPSVPFMFVFDSSTHYFYLNDTRQQQSEWRSASHFAEFIGEVEANQIAARGGRGWLNRVARAFFDLYVSFVDLLFGAPLVALLVLGLPLGVLSILVYALCCLDSDAQPSIDPDELEREFADSEGEENDRGELSDEAYLARLQEGEEQYEAESVDDAALRHRETSRHQHAPQTDYSASQSDKKTA